MAIKLENIANRANEVKDRVEAWWQDHGNDVLDTAGQAVLAGVLGYGLGSLYLDITGLRTAQHKVDCHRTYLLGLEDGQHMMANALQAARDSNTQQNNSTN